MGRMKFTSLLSIAAIVSCFMMQPTNGLIHVVGGSFGWDIPEAPNFYCQWASHRTFGVGDKLVFPYRPAAEDVYQVTKESFDGCNFDNVINQWMLGPTTVTLNTPGDYYFFSSVGTHCEMGMKLHIVVRNAPGSDGVNWSASFHQSIPVLHHPMHVYHHPLPVIRKSLAIRRPLRTGRKPFPTTIHPFIKRKLLSHSPTVRSEESLA